MSILRRILSWLAVAFAVLAVLSAVVLLADTAKPRLVPFLTPDQISAAPLIAVGLAFLLFQPVLRPRALVLLKHLILVLAFLLWGLAQILSASPISKPLGYVVIVLYVIELVWTILASLRPAKSSKA